MVSIVLEAKIFVKLKLCTVSAHASSLKVAAYEAYSNSWSVNLKTDNIIEECLK